MRRRVKIAGLSIVLIISIATILIIAQHLGNIIYRYILTRRYYNYCRRLAQHKHKKLMVIGDPCCVTSKVCLPSLFKICGHGDVTIDLYGCDRCDKMDINRVEEWRKYGTNQYVVFETATMSFCDNLPRILAEIKRISGGDFYSSGGTRSLLWRYLGNRWYSSKFKSPLTGMTYPFTPSQPYYRMYSFTEKRIQLYPF